MSETYTSLTARVIGEATINVNDALFTTLWPSLLSDAETRILRDLDMLISRKYAQTSFAASAPGNARLGLPTDCLVIRELAYYTPVATTTVYIPLERKTESYIKDYWRNRSLTGLPKYFCDLGSAQALVAPSPNGAYAVEAAYTYRPPSLAVAAPGDGTQTTYIATFHADLLFQACMVEVAGFKKNYGSMADDPQQAVSWNARYAVTLASAQMEEGRRKSGSYADESKTAAPEKNAVQ
jgi:hypothetical protein